MVMPEIQILEKNDIFCQFFSFIPEIRLVAASLQHMSLIQDQQHLLLKKT